MLNIGVDTGGTFTDFVVFDDAQNILNVAKTASTPEDPTDAFMAGLAQLDIDLSAVRRVVHGTTIATNAVLEHKGDLTAVIVTRGHRDVVELGQLRQYSDNVLFNRFYQRPAPFVPRTRRFEISERIDTHGEVVLPIDGAELDAIIDELEAQGVESVAVCLINAYVNESHEEAVAKAVKARLPNVAVSRSVQVSAEFREFERWATTTLNAYVDNTVSAYLARLSGRLREAGYAGELFYITSSGGILTESAAPEQPVKFLLSGPAGGIRAATYLGEHAGVRNVITYDMGGTSTDISLIEDLHPIVSHEKQFAGTVIKTPQLDIVAIGAGGGSIAWVDNEGGLKVGPQSAGSDPGPACYGRGGTEPTVTDANLLLGRIGESAALGGRMQLDRKLAEQAIASLGKRVGIDDPVALAEGILRICNTNMAGAVRTVSVERGLDPRDFALMPMGGAGPMHAAMVADDLGINRILVPPNPGNGCATGLLTTDIQLDYVRTYVVELQDMDLAKLHQLVLELEAEGAGDLASEGVENDRISVSCSADLRYVGQSFRLEVPVGTGSSAEDIADAFHERYRQVYGYARREKPVELVFVRAVARGAVDKPAPEAALTSVAESAAESGVSRDVVFDGTTYSAAIVSRTELGRDGSVEGPAIIEEYGSTVVVPPGWSVAVDAVGNLDMTNNQGHKA